MADASASLEEAGGCSCCSILGHHLQPSKPTGLRWRLAVRLPERGIAHAGALTPSGSICSPDLAPGGQNFEDRSTLADTSGTGFALASADSPFITLISCTNCAGLRALRGRHTIPVRWRAARRCAAHREARACRNTCRRPAPCSAPARARCTLRSANERRLPQVSPRVDIVEVPYHAPPATPAGRHLAPLPARATSKPATKQLARFELHINCLASETTLESCYDRRLFLLRIENWCIVFPLPQSLLFVISQQG